MLTYAASLSDESPLPAWLNFNASTRNFSGTPAAPDIGPLDIRVMASDGAGGSISDTFILTVSSNQPPVVANPIADQSATVGTPFSFTFPTNTFSDPNAGTVLTYAASLSNGSAIPAWLNFTAGTRNFSGTPAAANVGPLDIRVTASDGAGGSISDTFILTVNAAGTTSFYRALNLNGTALSIDGNNWEASVGAPNFTYTTNQGVFANQNIPLVPPTDANRSTMIHSSIWGGNVNLAVSAVPAGTYQVSLYVWEDNAAQIYTVSLEGAVVKANHNSGGAGVWSKLGPYQATINDGAVNVSAVGGHAMLSGLEIWRVNQPGGNQPPVVANPIADQSATMGTPYNFTFAANTFSDPNAGTVLTYTASLSSGGAIPAWLTFNAGTRNFSGTPVAPAGPLDVRVTASDGAGGSISDVFVLTVNAAGTLTFYRAINVNGAALSIDGNNWEASAGAPNFTYTTNNGVFANQNIPLVPPTDANRSTMIHSSVWGGNVNLALSAVPAGTYQVSLYVWEDNAAQIYSVSLEGTVVKANHNSGGAGVWSKLGPYQATISDGTVNVSAVGGHAMLSGLEVWRVQSTCRADGFPRRRASAW